MSTPKDDQDWLALVAGQSVPDADPDTIREARALRDAILAAQDETAPAPDPPAYARLLARLRQEGLLLPSSPDSCGLSSGLKGTSSSVS
jgi:hypothetical protein